jgi:hypothetical protein
LLKPSASNHESNGELQSDNYDKSNVKESFLPAIHEDLKQDLQDEAPKSFSPATNNDTGKVIRRQSIFQNLNETAEIPI